MFSTTTRFEVLVSSAPDAFVGGGRKEPVIGLVSRQSRWLFGDSRDDVGIGVSRIYPGDVRLGHGHA